jgi:hypothetical protein
LDAFIKTWQKEAVDCSLQTAMKTAGVSVQGVCGARASALCSVLGCGVICCLALTQWHGHSCPSTMLCYQHTTDTLMLNE